MRDGWVETTLGELAEITTGSRAKGGAITSGIPSIGGEQIAEDRSIKFNKMKFVPEEHFASMRTGKLKFGDSLLVKDGATTGKVGYWRYSIPAAVNEHVFILRARPDTAEPYFINLLISHQSFREEIESRTRGIIGGITRDIENIEFVIPPLPEQKRIVDLISSVDLYIEALQQELESAKKSRNALVESQILELSDSSLSSLKNLSTKIGSGATPRGGEEVYIETGVNLIRSQNVHDSNFVMRGLVAIEDSAAKALENVTVEKDDVLINITGASVTRCCVVDSTILPARVNQHVAIIRSDKAKILPKYLVLVLTSNEVKGFLNDIAGTGSTRQALTKSHLEDLEIPVPSISKQTEIIENSDAFDIVTSKSQIALDEAKIVRSGLLSDLLSGEHEIPASYDKVIGAA
jgi:restriction endonuclease S subunit